MGKEGGDGDGRRGGSGGQGGGGGKRGRRSIISPPLATSTPPSSLFPSVVEAKTISIGATPIPSAPGSRSSLLLSNSSRVPS
ncbi:hypothetical protein C1H46_038841 [Malus baccata]|uniref:Uncharacterized protein n=1 Tax=Malus baccata TaxID=106549 RepID=A0A540KN31_MALBA|nr:hypothetical protein C1H46_038841 [Malus baccata]